MSQVATQPGNNQIVYYLRSDCQQSHRLTVRSFYYTQALPADVGPSNICHLQAERNRRCMAYILPDMPILGSQVLVMPIDDDKAVCLLLDAH